jgi:6-phosphofructokinase 1
VREITHLGGTILGTTNRGNPFCWPRRRADGRWEELDRSGDVISGARTHRLDAVVVIGGDGTLRIAHDLGLKGLPVVGIPKTIDNDVAGTSASLGYHTAVNTATDAIDRVRSTAESHERVMVLEVMGRHAGWIALNSGLAGGADAILLPEIPFDVAKVCAHVHAREAEKRRFAIVVVAEGAVPTGGQPLVRAAAAPGGMERLGGVGEVVASAIAEGTGKEARCVTLGHLQRGGSPMWFDRLLALRFGVAAIRSVAAGQFGVMVGYESPDVRPVSLAEVIAASPRSVGADSDAIRTARELGISLG